MTRRRAVLSIFAAGLLVVIASLRPGRRMYATKGLFANLQGVGYLTHQVCFKRFIEAEIIDWSGGSGSPLGLVSIPAGGFNVISRKLAELLGRTDCPAGADLERFFGELDDRLTRRPLGRSDADSINFLDAEAGRKARVQVGLGGTTDRAIGIEIICTALRHAGLVNYLDAELISGKDRQAEQVSCSIVTTLPNPTLHLTASSLSLGCCS